MSGSYTMPLSEVMQFTHDTGNGFRLGLDDYPIFDEDYRDGLNRKIIEHYRNREIAHFTVPEFTWALRRKMHEIMPLYNQVYESTLTEFDWLSTVDLTTDRDDKSTGNVKGSTDGKSNVASQGNSFAVNSETPQTMLSEDEDYASGGTQTQSGANTDTTNEGTSNTDSTEETIGNSRTKGYQGSPADLLMKFRASFLNTDMLVIEQVEECFFGLWGTGRPEFASNGLIYLGMGYRI